MKALSFAVLISAALSQTSIALAGIIVPLPTVLDSGQNSTFSINDNNIIAGQYQARDDDSLLHGFFGTLDGQYTTFQVGASNTRVRGLNNDGYITGYALGYPGNDFVRTPSGGIENVTDSKHDGVQVVGAMGAIIAHQKFVGSYLDKNSVLQGFYGVDDHLVGKVDLPFSTDSVSARGYNKSGAITGQFHDTSVGDYPGFVINKGVATSVRFPDQRSYGVQLTGINDAGLIVGGWIDSNGVLGQAFLYDQKKNAFKIIHSPTKYWAAATSVNNANLVTIITSEYQSFLYCPKKKSCPVHARSERAIANEWILASPKYIHSRQCVSDCMAEVSLTN